MPDTVTFASLGVHAGLIEKLAQQQITTPTAVQIAVLKAKNPDGDLVVQARTGSGKTLAFGLSILEKLDAANASPQALIITPTRELAQQVAQSLRPLAQVLGLRTETLTGGADMVAQLRSLRAGVHLVVGTPGRIVDHLNRGSLRPQDMKTVILDEGDQMLDLGFKDELEVILGAMPEGRRTLLFSATMPAEMRSIAQQYMQGAETITLEGSNAQHIDIEHVAVRVPRSHKIESLVNLLRLVNSDRAMLFSRTKADTEEICRRLVAEGFSAGYLHGDLDQRERNRVLSSFRHGKLNLLVATEVAARGIDVPGVSHVINVDLPFSLEAYVHRSGRTGRAGSKGQCFSLVCANEGRFFRRVMSEGRINAVWQDVPTPAMIRQVEQQRLRQAVLAQMESTEPDAVSLALAIELLADAEPVTVLAKLLASQVATDAASSFDLAAAAEQDWARERAFNDTRNPRGAVARSRGADRAAEGSFSRFRINLGHKDQVHAGKLVNLLCTMGGITGRQIGAIRIQNDHTFFEVQTDAVHSFVKKTSSATAGPAGMRVRIESIANPTSPMPQSSPPRRGFNGITRTRTHR